MPKPKRSRSVHIHAPAGEPRPGVFTCPTKSMPTRRFSFDFLIRVAERRPVSSSHLNRLCMSSDRTRILHSQLSRCQVNKQIGQDSVERALRALSCRIQTFSIRTSTRLSSDMRSVTNGGATWSEVKLYRADG